MPGLCGFLLLKYGCPSPDFDAMVNALTYGRATVVERCQGNTVGIGCAHLGTGGQKALHESAQACVIFYGYLTQPAIPPGANESDRAEAAHCIHDQYLDSGEPFLKNIMGAYSFALWDKRSKTLVLANDRLGMRPIYYAVHKDALLFASEVKSLLADSSLPRRLDDVAASEFFHFRYILGNRTFFEDIRLIPPASYLVCRDGKWAIIKYWEPAYVDRVPRRSDQWCDQQIYEALKVSIERMARPNLRYGISLSSGIDSRWIAALLSEIRPDTKAFTFEGTVTASAESKVAARVAALTGLEHHQLSLPPDFVAHHAERVAYISDGMHSFVDFQEFPLTLEMSNSVDVAVGGFMGSAFFNQHPLHYFLRAKDVYAFRRLHIKSYLLPRSKLERVFGAEKYKDLEDAAYGELRAAVNEAPARKGFQILGYEGIRQRQRRFTFYAQLLKTPYVDMYHPIADNSLWELSMHLHPAQLFYKRALRHALAAYFPHLAELSWNKIPGPATARVSSILMRQFQRRISTQILELFEFSKAPHYASHYTDYAKWLKDPLRGFVEAVLLSPEANATGLFAPDGLREVIQDHLEGRLDATVFLGVALPFAMWTHMFYLPATPRRPDILAGSRMRG